LHGSTMEWVIERRESLREMFVNALVSLARIYVRRDKPVLALGYFVRALKAYPLREDVQRDVIELYLSQGMVADAKRQYRSLEELLRKQQDMAPSPETRELYERVLRAE
jgi:DNA-binding SARP family transcriptional activator